MVMNTSGVSGVRHSRDGKARVHVLADNWGKVPFATDFWFYPHPDVITASAPGLLSALGWTSNGTLSVVKGSAGDLLSSADFGTPGHILFNSASEWLLSPIIFGNWSESAYWIRDQLGWTPSLLIAEFYAAFTTATNAETASAIGFVEDTGSIITAADALATVHSDGTQFRIRSGAATGTGTTAIDTNWHRWKIVLHKGLALCYLFQDGASIDSVALETDEFPVGFGAGIVAAGANVIGLGATHIWYDA